MGFGFNNENYHAEVDVIIRVKKEYGSKNLKKICFREGGLILEVVRFNNTGGDFKLSKPCLECQHRIGECKGIIKVFYS